MSKKPFDKYGIFKDDDGDFGDGLESINLPSSFSKKDLEDWQSLLKTLPSSNKKKTIESEPDYPFVDNKKKDKILKVKHQPVYKKKVNKETIDKPKKKANKKMNRFEMMELDDEFFIEG